MSLDLSHFQNPKTAIIRLLRSQCLCANKNNNISKQIKTQSQLSELLKYKQQLQIKVNRERNKLKQTPCVLTLAEEIQQVKQIISGLTRQNRQRIQELINLEKSHSEVQYFSGSEQADLYEHEKLQAQYNNLLKTLEMTNDHNQRLIRRLTQI